MELRPALTPAHRAVLGWIGEHAPADVVEIAAGLGLEVDAVDALLGELEALELIASRHLGRVC